VILINLLPLAQVLEKDLLPILVNSREDGEAFDAAVRLLVNLTVPVECLLPIGTRQQTFILDILVFSFLSDALFLLTTRRENLGNKSDSLRTQNK
jgi:hypothetical protein